MDAKLGRCRITEIFYSLQGESINVGLPTVFVRLTGCPLRCQYCDTAYAFKGGKMQGFDEILTQIKAYHTQYICVTGGEPLAQKSGYDLIHFLCEHGYQVSIETSGARDISMVDSRAMLVMDIKTPGSLEVDKNLMSNLKHLKPTDQLKFVICHHEDYIWSRDWVLEHQKDLPKDIIFSPSYHQVEPRQLAEWILEDQLPVRFGFQLHKAVWGELPGK